MTSSESVHGATKQVLKSEYNRCYVFIDFLPLFIKPTHYSLKRCLPLKHIKIYKILRFRNTIYFYCRVKNGLIIYHNIIQRNNKH